jgi:hypothetical protein
MASRSPNVADILGPTPQRKMTVSGIREVSPPSIVCYKEHNKRKTRSGRAFTLWMSSIQIAPGTPPPHGIKPPIPAGKPRQVKPPPIPSGIPPLIPLGR